MHSFKNHKSIFPRFGYVIGAMKSPLFFPRLNQDRIIYATFSAKADLIFQPSEIGK